MAAMTACERFKRMFNHQEADRVPIIDGPWPATLERWQAEGMPADVPFEEFFGMDAYRMIGVDVSPRYPHELIEETDDYRIERSAWGTTMKNWKHAASTPEFLDFTITDPDKWRAAKERMTPTRDRIDWAMLEANYKTWRENGDWILANLWFGFDVTHSWAVGTERILMALAMEPEWVSDMFNTCLDMSLALIEMIWDEGYEFDSIFWCDDMGFKNKQFFSVDTYRELLKPVHGRAVEWAHAHGITAHLHSCGDITPLVPEILDIGVDGLNPLEVKAGMDPLALKKQYGDRLLLHGGINALLYDDFDKIEAEVRRVLPALKESGGYVFSSDHSVPSSVSLQDFQRLVNLAKELGSYE